MESTLNSAEVQRLLRVSSSTVRDMLAHGELKGFQRGKVIRIDRRSVDRLLGRETTEKAGVGGRNEAPSGVTR